MGCWVHRPNAHNGPVTLNYNSTPPQDPRTTELYMTPDLSPLLPLNPKPQGGATSHGPGTAADGHQGSLCGATSLRVIRGYGHRHGHEHWRRD